MNYQNLFNKDYINYEYYEEIERNQFLLNQNQELAKMLNALNDFIDSYNKIAPQYQQQAFSACVCLICEKLYGKANDRINN